MNLNKMKLKFMSQKHLKE